ncbi:butyrophilin subfamily 3 member A2-like [Phaenicophaeus curvirostris]|uniref:butyrophilin subfamily 3 member A2-like n=1 Tax=Phaenicophaeus curvirostris TaxID=33595 RepID=UPI0037F09B70
MTMNSPQVFEVTSPPNVVGRVNGDAILPCYVSSAKPLEDVEVRWEKIAGGKVETVLAQGKLGRNQAPRYLGRTSLPGDGFSSGNVSLRLKKVQPSDGGTYSCFVQARNQSAGASVVLRVSGTGAVVFEVLGPKGDDLQLACQSEGWFPEPTVRWVTRSQEDLLAETTLWQNSSQLFGVLSRVTVTRGQGEEVTCQVLNPLVRAEEMTVRLSSESRPPSRRVRRRFVALEAP